MKRASLALFLLPFAFGCKEREEARPYPGAEPEIARATPEVGAAPSETHSFTLIATGDNRGKVAPCGCEPPNGGLARRVAAVQQLRSEGPVLALDAGDSLFAPREDDSEKARLILSAMAATGVAAAAVGEGDLARGLGWLVEEAARAGVPFLSANLRDESGNAPFPGRRRVEVGGHQVGIFSILTHSQRLPAGITLSDPIEAGRAEIRALREEGVDLVIGLVHGSMRDVNQAARELDVDFIVAAHNGGNTRPYQHGEAWVAYSGYEGRTFLEAEFDLRGEGKLVSEDELEELRVRREELQRKIELGREQLSQTALAAHREEVEKLVAGFERDLAQLERDSAIIDDKSGRRFRSRIYHLDGARGEDPAFLEEIAKLGAL